MGMGIPIHMHTSSLRKLYGLFFVTTSAPWWIQTVEMHIFMKYSRENFTESFNDTDTDQ